MNKKIESCFVYILCLIFIVGSALLYLIFYESQEPNFYALIIFLISILVLTLLYDKIEELSVSKEGVKAKMREVDYEIKKAVPPQSVVIKTKGKTGTIHEKSYDPELEIEKGV